MTIIHEELIKMYECLSLENYESDPNSNFGKSDSSSPRLLPSGSNRIRIRYITLG